MLKILTAGSIFDDIWNFSGFSRRHDQVTEPCPIQGKKFHLLRKNNLVMRVEFLYHFSIASKLR